MVSPRPHSFPSALLVTALALAARTDPRAQTASRPSLEQRIVAAESLLQRGRAEEAAATLRELLPELRAISSEAARAPVATAVNELLAKADPRAPARAKAFIEAAKPLLKLAESYRKRGWHRSALLLLQEAGELDPDSVQKPLAELQKLVPPNFGKPVPRGEDGGRVEVSPKTLFASAERLGTRTEWTIDTQGVASPQLDPRSEDNLAILVAKELLTGNYRYGFEVETKGKIAQSALVFGYRAASDYWCLDFTDTPSNLLGSIRLFRIQAAGITSEAAATAELDLRSLPTGSWVPIEIEVRAGVVKVSVNRRVAFSKAIGERLDGRFGIMIGQLSPCHEPIRFRKFHTEKL